MKRIKVAPGKFVTISTELAEKAARVFATGLTRDQVRDLKASEPRRGTVLMAGSPKPLAIAQGKARVATSARPKIAIAPARKITTSISSAAGALRRKAG
jgi:hypothetical protein